MHHQRPVWSHAVEVPRIRGRKLQRLRKELFNKQPLCVICEKEGRVRVATIRDHIINLASPGGTDTEDNVQAICEECHMVKTQNEAKRGMVRNV